MNTYEGTMIIKWYKNDNGDVRPLRVECNSKSELDLELQRIKSLYMTIGDDPTYHLVKKENINNPAFNVLFYLNEIK